MRPFLCCFALLLLFPSCGGGAATTGEAKSADSSDARSDDASGDSDESEGNGESASTPDQPQGPNCDDGTCSLCGNSICPAGWYCDEEASACSWLTECAEKPSCGCVTRVLGSACKCKEERGGLKVACD